MKTKILLILALLAAPVVHSANPQAGDSVETDPRLIEEFCVDHVESIAFKEFCHDTVVAFCYLNGGCFVTESQIKNGKLIGIGENEYPFRHIRASYQFVCLNIQKLTIAGIKEATPNILILSPDWVHGRKASEYFELNKETTHFEFDQPIKSFVFSSSRDLIYVTLENDETYSIDTLKRSSPVHHQEPSRWYIFKYGWRTNILSSHTPSGCCNYLSNHLEDFLHNPVCHRQYIEPVRPHCLSDLSGKRLALVRCTSPHGYQVSGNKLVWVPCSNRYELNIYKFNDHEVCGRPIDYEIAGWRTVPLDKEPSCLKLDGNSDLIILGYTDGTIELRNTEDFELYGSINLDKHEPSTYTISKLVLSPLTRRWKADKEPIYLVVVFLKNAETSETIQIWDVKPLIVRRLLDLKPRRQARRRRIKSLVSQSQANEKEKKS